MKHSFPALSCSAVAVEVAVEVEIEVARAAVEIEANATARRQATAPGFFLAIRGVSRPWGPFPKMIVPVD